MAKDETPEEAYARAEARIAQAKAEGWAELELRGGDFGDFDALSRLPPGIRDLTALQSLNIDNTQVQRINPLWNLTALQNLSLNATDFQDLTPLRNLTALKNLNLNDTPVQDIDTLRNLTSLQHLNLYRTPVQDLSPLQNLPALQSLQLIRTDIGDLTPLRNLAALKELLLSRTGVQNIDPLRSLTALQTLSLNNTLVQDVDPLRSLTALQHLDLNDTQVQDITPLRDLTALQTLRLSHTQVQDIDLLRNLTALRHLHLNNTQVQDITPLRDLTALQTLSLNNTQVQDITPLRDLTALQTLSLNNTLVQDIDPLRDLTALRHLHLSNTRVGDLRPLIHITGLAQGRLWFLNIPATDLDPRLKDLSGIKDVDERTTHTLAYLKTLGDDWPPAPDAPIDTQNPAALTFGTDADGRVALNTAPAPADLPPQAAMLHHLLRGQAADLRDFCTTPNREHDRVCGKLSRYLDALGPGPDAMAPAPVLWMAGNDLRNILKADGAKTGEEMGEAPPLGPDRRADLTGLVQTHNAFAALHPDMSQLDHDAIDPVDRVFGAQDRDALHGMVRVLEAQIAMLTDQVRADLASLDAAARGNASGAERALSLESESLHNLVKLVAAEVVIEIQSHSRPRLRDDIRSALIDVGVGVATTNASLDPVITQNLPELLLLLKPYAATLLTCWQGNTGNLATVMDWVELRLRGGG